MFSVLPTKGTLSPVDRPAQVQVIFKSNREVHVKDQPILRCQVIEPNIGDEGETIASIPIKLSVRSVFSKWVFSMVGHLVQNVSNDRLLNENHHLGVFVNLSQAYDWLLWL